MTVPDDWDLYFDERRWHVQARRQEQPFNVLNADGRFYGEAGDYIVKRDNGSLTAMAAAEFEARHVFSWKLPHQQSLAPKRQTRLLARGRR